MESKQIKVLLFIPFLMIFTSLKTYSQQNFTVLKPGEYTIREKKNEFLNNIKVNGEFNAYWGVRTNAVIPDIGVVGTTGQDVQLRIQSKINYDASLNITLKNRYSDISRQKGGYTSQDINDTGDNSSDTGMTIVFDEAYLEYNHNPNAKLKIGRHYVDVADKKGFIYQGTANAISQECRIGTWCYYIGGASLSDTGDAIYWLQLDYPVFESGVLIQDPWSNTLYQKESLNIELFRVLHFGKDIPLAKYGGSTGENSSNHARVDSTGDAVYFDNDGVEYLGVNIRWQHDVLSMNMTLASVTGNRKYHTGTEVQSNTSALGTKGIRGSLYYVSLDYRYHPEWRLEVATLSSSGSDLESSSSEIWDQDLAAFVEVQKGDHGDALIYFNGKNGLSDGHSVMNLSYDKIGFSYKSLAKDFFFDIHLFQFKHTVDVYTIGDKKEASIGRELDIRLGWNIKENLIFDMFWGVFSTDNAYSENDNIQANNPLDNYSMFGYQVIYRF
ncbi:MAG: hypothetical protein GY786_13595 [Proteobacteria bacterium]|nr:hypothetical protein [Pseudomonadota bacterium]